MKYFVTILILSLATSCSKERLKEISVNDFREFVNATDYITDAEKYDWSIVQIDVYNFIVLGGVNWKCPDGLHLALDNEPVTQISYNDALAYCEWSKTKLPTYNEYWRLNANSKLSVNQNSTLILPIGNSSIVGNVWELTEEETFNQIRLAGGSYLCSINSCNGTNPNRELYVDRITGNSHIGFAVIQ